MRASKDPTRFDGVEFVAVHRLQRRDPGLRARGRHPQRRLAFGLGVIERAFFAAANPRRWPSSVNSPGGSRRPIFADRRPHRAACRRKEAAVHAFRRGLWPPRVATACLCGDDIWLRRQIPPSLARSASSRPVSGLHEAMPVSLERAVQYRGQGQVDARPVPLRTAPRTWSGSRRSSPRSTTVSSPCQDAPRARPAPTTRSLFHRRICRYGRKRGVETGDWPDGIANIVPKMKGALRRKKTPLHPLTGQSAAILPAVRRALGARSGPRGSRIVSTLSRFGLSMMLRIRQSYPDLHGCACHVSVRLRIPASASGGSAKGSLPGNRAIAAGAEGYNLRGVPCGTAGTGQD